MNHKLILFSLLLGACYTLCAQENSPYYMSPKENEYIVEFYQTKVPAGTYDPGYFNTQRDFSIDEIVEIIIAQLYAQGKGNYSSKNIRNLAWSVSFENRMANTGEVVQDKFYSISANIVTNYVQLVKYSLTEAIEKALRKVPEGSRIAVNHLEVINKLSKEECKDDLIAILLEKEYRVVAKEFLAKLYEEQQNQQSGIYNERTTVQENNFSAIGYFINVKVTEKSVRVQVVNVSTGEYEGNTTINFNTSVIFMFRSRKAAD